MLSNMSNSVFAGLVAVTVAIPTLAWSGLLPVHNVRSRSVTYLYESDYTQNQNTNHTVTGGNATFSWQENTLLAFGNLRATTKSGDTFELKLVRTASSDLDEVSGEWDVFKNGNPVCSGCKGYLYVAPPDLGMAYLKGYVNSSTFGVSFSADVSDRSDY